MTIKNYTVVPYQPSWPIWFKEESDNIKLIFKHAILKSHHIGSTSVPGLAGKPTIDMLFIVKNVSQIDSQLILMEKIGYQSLGAKNDPGTRLLEKYVNGQRRFIAHFYPVNHPEIKQMLATRDYLRSHPLDTKKYSVLKFSLFKKFPNYYQKYSAQKYKLMATIKKKALAWSNNITAFQNARQKEKNKIFKKLITIFSAIALEGHIFGSLARGSSDEFSDIDFWATFSDQKIKKIIAQRLKLYKKIGKIIIYHEAQQNYPLGGTYAYLLFQTSAGPIHVDLYLSPKNSARLWGKSKILFNKKNLKIPKGKMIYETKRETRDIQDRVKFIICMTFNGIKKIIRKNDNKFLDFLVEIYNDLRQKSFPKIKKVTPKNSTKTLEKILDNLFIISNRENRQAIQQIKLFLNQIKKLYL
ncbi:GrpB family protein [Candidatus Kuenenbacteria bacterium]|nr:GrpB family protein [Candidatus Kuenenbacteria bacterium]